MNKTRQIIKRQLNTNKTRSNVNKMTEYEKHN